MSRKRKDGHDYTLWHDRLDESKVAEYANKLIHEFFKKGIRIKTIQVHWDDDGHFITETSGSHFRRIEDKKTPEKH